MDCKAEEITPYDNKTDKTSQVKKMFDSIAPAYDFMNRAMTFGIDKLWRRKAVNMLRKYSPREILDVATGTGDLALQLYESLNPDHVTGVDLSAGMLKIAQQKIATKGLQEYIGFEEGDCLDLRYVDESFDAVTVAYGVRNFEKLQQGYSEMHRVLMPGGVLCVVELSTPTNPIIKPMYNFYSRILIPLIGRMVSKDARAYSYLPESIAAVAQGEDMLKIMREAGFSKCYFKRLTLGTCTIYIGVK